jgi:putative nucleotidyltransferase with HDIG domain
LRAPDLIPVVTALQPAPASVPADDDTLDRIALAFAWVIDAKTPYTYEHSEGVAALSEQIAVRIGFTAAETRRLRQMALLHDIGKLAVPNRILDKQASLTPDDRRIIREHPRHTFDILRCVPIFEEFADDASAHHERLDGRGYHRGLDKTGLTPAARALAVADVTDALLADRPYRKGMPADAVAHLLRDWRGTALCAPSVDAALDVLGTRAPGRRRPTLILTS